MKKAFGIIFLLAGLVMIILGIAALTNLATKHNTIEDRFGNAINENYYERNQEQQAVGVAFTGCGLIFFIIGIVMVATKSGAQRRKEEELAYLKRTQQSQPSSSDNGRKAEVLIQQAIALYNQQEYHPAIILTQQAKALNPASSPIHYNLACLYSLTQNTEAFDSLSKAIELGYTNFEKIKTQRDLDWLRHHQEYNDFVKNGYRLKIKTNDHKTYQQPEQSTDDIYEKLEKLGKLKEKGVINEEEFAKEKKKILG
ncbi:MAG: hypothetical protein JWP12_3320 [Bacteroidetes bacterium]|nr:hypothetical protein [Bacteroidota bacterium]